MDVEFGLDIIIPGKTDAVILGVTILKKKLILQTNVWQFPHLFILKIGLQMFLVLLGIPVDNILFSVNLLKVDKVFQTGLIYIPLWQVFYQLFWLHIS